MKDTIAIIQTIIAWEIGKAIGRLLKRWLDSTAWPWIKRHRAAISDYTIVIAPALLFVLVMLLF